MDPGKSDEGPSLPKKSNEEKASRYFELPFRVNLTGNKLNLVKPVEKRVVDITYPTVCFKEETAGNDHAFNIMFNIKHDIILSMELVCENKLSNDKNSVATFVEPYDSLWPLKLRDFADEIGHIPSPKFQSYLRQIIMGLDHLRMYDLYHGNLRWDSTLKHGDTIKLAGFRSQELKSKTEAQWGDWISLLGMLEVVLDLVRNDLEAHTYFCGHLISLINMMKTLNRESLPTIKDTVLEQMFFWDKRRRLKFFSYTVSLKLKDANFMKRVAKSGIREKGWDKDCTPLFKRLVKKANDYHEAQRENTRKDEKGKSSEDKDKNEGDYNGDSLADYVRLICGGCTHHRQLELDVDTIIRENHPAILSDIKEILEAPDEQDSPGHQSRGASQLQNIPGPSRGHMERQSRPSRGHMERQSPYSSRGASQHQNIPGPSSVPSQHPSYGSRGAPHRTYQVHRACLHMVFTMSSNLSQATANSQSMGNLRLWKTMLCCQGNTMPNRQWLPREAISNSHILMLDLDSGPSEVLHTPILSTILLITLQLVRLVTPTKLVMMLRRLGKLSTH